MQLQQWVYCRWVEYVGQCSCPAHPHGQSSALSEQDLGFGWPKPLAAPTLRTPALIWVDMNQTLDGLESKSGWRLSAICIVRV